MINKTPAFQKTENIVINLWICWLLRHTDEPQNGRNSCLWLQSRSVLSSFGVVLMSCRVDFLVVRSALQYSALKKIWPYERGFSFTRKCVVVFDRRPKKVAAIRSLLCCRDGRKAGFQFSQGSFLIYKFCLLLVFRNIN